MQSRMVVVEVSRVFFSENKINFVSQDIPLPVLLVVVVVGIYFHHFLVAVEEGYLVAVEEGENAKERVFLFH